MKKIVVGTENPVKLNAVKIAFEKIFPNEDIEVVGCHVESGVSAQPMSTEELIMGARNRANRALMTVEDAEFGVGLEGGLELISKNWFNCGWCVIVDKFKNEGIGSSARMEVPKIFIDKINEGKELGEVEDEVFNMKNSKQDMGFFGLMTNNAVTRTEGYVQGTCMAFARFLHPELFKE